MSSIEGIWRMFSPVSRKFTLLVSCGCGYKQLQPRQTKPEDIRGNGEELPGLLSRRMEKLAPRLEPANFLELGSTQSQSDADDRFVGDGSGRREGSDSCGLKTVVRALAKVEALLSAAKKGG
jgi:hypothetical protein